MNNDHTKCYMCDENATGKEHVPPKCLFPKSKDLEKGEDLKKELLTVPSCDLHNLEKSGNDEYFLNVITSIQGINKTGRQHYKKQIRRRNSRNPSIIKRFAGKSIEINKQLAFEVEIERLDEFIEHFAFALFFAHFGNKWHGDVEWIPESLAQIQNHGEAQDKIKLIRAIDLMFNNIEMHGKNKEVFMYQVVKDSQETKMRLNFYGSLKIFLSFPK